MQQKTDNVIIIGAGPAGLATAGRLRKGGIPFEIIEKTSHVADRWHHHYDRLHLHTVKQFSHLPYLEFPDSYPMYVPKNALIAYFEDYAKQFDIHPRFGTEAYEIKKNSEYEWEVTTNSGKIKAKHVIISTGINKSPYLPVWKGQEAFQGKISHSIQYKNATPYRNHRVLVIGMGNTGAEIALDLAETDIQTWISVRRPVNIVPRDLNGRPVQVTSKLLEKLPFGFGDWLGAKVQKLYFGNLRKYGLEQSSRYPAAELRETGKTPVIDIGTIKAIKQGKIRVVGEIDHFETSGVHFKNGTSLKCDHVIAATGYRHNLEDLVENIGDFLDPNGYPLGPVGSGVYSGLYFAGFDNYKLGGILGTIYNDSETIVKVIQGIS